MKTNPATVNLTRLLAASTCLTEVREAPRPYKMGHGLLPKFGPTGAGSAPNAPTKGGRSAARAAAAPTVDDVWGVVVGTADRGHHSERATTNPAAGGARQARAQATDGSAGVRRLNPFARIWPATTRREPVQTELALSTVKVVRNDLADADLEVVSAADAAMAGRNAARHPIGSAAAAAAAGRDGVRAEAMLA